MPHAVTKGIGLQALILCGPGSSFSTFTANPDENPKALLPIANRPMVWYPLDFCNRAGILDVTLICPPLAAQAIRAALKTNPFLTSLPAPAVLAPQDLDQTTGTAAILRLPEVRSLVVSDFVVLPCDLVCELGGERLLQAWIASAASLADLLGEADLGRPFSHSSRSIGGGGGGGSGGNSGGVDGDSGTGVRRASLSGGHAEDALCRPHSGGLGVWYDTRVGITPVKSEETDFVATVPMPWAAAAAGNSGRTSGSASLLPQLERVVTAMPTDSLTDLAEETGGYLVRHGLLRRHRRVRMRTTHRDAHIYVFPQWVMDFVQANQHMDSIGEDVVGWWAKAEWQKGLPAKLGMDAALKNYGASAAHHNGDDASSSHAGNADGSSTAGDGGVDDDDVDNDVGGDANNGGAGDGESSHAAAGAGDYGRRASTVSRPDRDDRPEDRKKKDDTAAAAAAAAPSTVAMPPMLAYVQPADTAAPLIRRVDTSQLLLAVSLQLAKLPSVEEVVAQGQPAAAAPVFAHAKKVAYPEGVKPRTTVTRADSLVAENVTVEEKVSIRECVVGANCQIHEGAKLHQCLLMDGVVVGKGCRLTRCVLGKRSEIGAQSVLVDCEVQEHLLVEPKTEEKDHNFMSSEGLETTAEELDEAMLDLQDEDEGAVDGL